MQGFEGSRIRGVECIAKPWEKKRLWFQRSGTVLILHRLFELQNIQHGTSNFVGYSSSLNLPSVLWLSDPWSLTPDPCSKFCGSLLDIGYSSSLNLPSVLWLSDSWSLTPALNSAVPCWILDIQVLLTCLLSSDFLTPGPWSLIPALNSAVPCWTLDIQAP